MFHLRFFCAMQRECLDRTKRVSREAVGQKMVGQKTVTGAGKMAAVSSGPSETKTKKVEELRQLLGEAEAESALDAAVATMHHITNDTRLGPVTKAVVEMEGAALLDTGSPVTIVSMSFFWRNRGLLIRHQKSGGGSPVTVVSMSFLLSETEGS